MAREVKKVVCELCEIEISASNLSKHLHRHEVHPETFRESYHLDHDDLFCKFCNKEFKNKNSLVQHEIRCRYNPNKIDIAPREGFNNKGRVAWNKGLTKETDERVKLHSESIKNHYISHPGTFTGRTHTEQTKQKISESRKKYLSEHPDRVPYIINHSSKMSYPEKYFKDIFESKSIPLKYHLQVSKYELDFYNEDIKLDLEIDGDQHYLDHRIYQSDRERDKFLSVLGWNVVRIRWSDYQKLSFQDKERVIQNIIDICTCNSVV